MSVLRDPTVCAAIRLAWDNSDPGSPEAHEEGGFVLRHPDGAIHVERWPRGAQNQIDVPDHARGIRGDAVILATFHTHPNAGAGFQQEPSLTDIRAVRNDPDLHHSEYEGEFVISTEYVYLIRPDGNVEVVGATTQVLQSD